MNQLNCELRYDDGRIEPITWVIGPGEDWRKVFDYLVQVYCGNNDVELFPINVTCRLTGLVDSEYDPYAAEMIEVVEEE